MFGASALISTARPEIAPVAWREILLITTAIVFDRAAVIEHNRIALK